MDYAFAGVRAFGHDSLRGSTALAVSKLAFYGDAVDLILALEPTLLFEFGIVGLGLFARAP